MDITFILPFNALNGGHRVVSTYARKLTERGHRVNVVSQPWEGRRSAKITLKRQIKRLLGRPAPMPEMPVRSTLLDFLGEQHIVLDAPGPPHPSQIPDADVIVATWWETAEWVSAQPASKGRKFYLLQDFEVFPYLPVDRVIGTYSLPLKKIAVSEYIRKEVQAFPSVGEIEVIPNAVDLGLFTSLPRQRNEVLTVGFLFSPSPRKNARLAIEILNNLKSQIPCVKALVFGTHPLSSLPPLPDWAQYERAPDQDRIPEIYAACDLWLFTSEKEGFGLPILEAMACRTPVLATRAGAAPQIVDGSNGTLLPMDVGAFVDEIARFAAMPDIEWQHYSEAAHRTATSYTWDKATDRLIGLMAQEHT